MYGLPIHFADIVNAADVRMRDLPRDSNFIVKTRESVGIRRRGFRQKFERHLLAQSEIGGAIHFAIPPRPSNPRMR